MSKRLHSPVHVGTINGHLVRFFKATSGRPEMPWHVFEDLAKAVGFEPDLRRQFLQVTQAEYKGEMQTLATSGGLVVIAPHYVAQGTVGAAIALRQCPERAEIEYAKEGAQALGAIMANVPPDRFMAFLEQAYRNTSGREGGNA